MKRRIFLWTALLLMGLAFLPVSAATADEEPVTDLNKAVKAAWAADKELSAMLSQIWTDSGDVAKLKTDYVAKANEKALGVASTLINLDFSLSKRQYHMAKKEMLQAKLDDALRDFKIGKKTEKEVELIRQQFLENEVSIDNYNMQLKNGEKAYESLVGRKIDLKEFDFLSAYFIMDAALIPVTLPDGSPVTGTKAEQKIKGAPESYSNLVKQLNTYIQTGRAYVQAGKDYKTGKISRDEHDQAWENKEQARINALQAKAEYSKMLYTLDCDLQGYLARELKKLKTPIFITPADIPPKPQEEQDHPQ